MRKTLPLTLIFSLCLLTGCSLIPKKVELFQDKVHRFPQPSAKQEEFQREAAALAKQRAAQTVDEAIKENASPFVLAPARDTEKLADAVSTSLGPPVKEATDASVADKLNSATGKYNNKVEDFSKENDKNANKKIEGTGLVQVPYFAWAGGVVALILLVWVVLKAVLTAASAANPGALIGVAGMNVAGNTLAKGFHQVVKGGELFKEWVGKELEPALQQKVLDAFTTLHKQAQDGDVKAIVDHIVK